MKYGIHPYYKSKLTIHTNGSTCLNTIPTISIEAFNSLLHQKINILINYFKENIQSNLLITQNNVLIDSISSKSLERKKLNIKKDQLEKYITQICAQYCLIVSQEYKTSRKYNFQKNIIIFGAQKTKYLLQTQILSNVTERGTIDKIQLSDIIFFKSKKNLHFTTILDVDTFSHSF
jgi:hypothetical protein